MTELLRLLGYAFIAGSIMVFAYSFLPENISFFDNEEK